MSKIVVIGANHAGTACINTMLDNFGNENEIVFNFRPWLEWYLETTGQRLVGGNGPFAPTGENVSADTTSGASDAGSHSDSTGEADATSAASSH